ncbi:MAG: hypothetical protein ACE5FT_03060 [Candidatus Nanoarchaeia archaeon]
MALVASVDPLEVEETITDKLVRHYMMHLGESWQKFGIGCPAMHTKLRSDFNLGDELILGVEGLWKSSAAFLAASKGAKYKGRPIRVVLTKPLPSKNYAYDPNTGALGASFFVTFNEKDGLSHTFLKSHFPWMDSLRQMVFWGIAVYLQPGWLTVEKCRQSRRTNFA